MIPLPKPQQLLEALQRVRIDHPYSISGTVTDTQRTRDGAGEIWNRILAISPKELHDTLSKLTYFDVQLLLFGARTRLNDPRAIDVLARIIALHRPVTYGALAWEYWLISQDQRFYAAAAAYLDEKPEHTLWPHLLRSSSPLAEAIIAIQESGLTLQEWAARPEVALHERRLVMQQLRRLLLERENLPYTTQREEHTDINQWVQTLIPKVEREQWYKDFLSTTYVSGWPERNSILEAVIDIYGSPDDERPFWNDVSLEVRREVTGWINAGNLSALLHGERARFWTRFRYDIRRLEESRSGEAVFINFDTWFAVQFKAMGRATYMFPSHQWRRLRWKDGHTLYREILDFAHEGEYLGRYEHRRIDWEYWAQREVQRVMREVREGTA